MEETRIKTKRPVRRLLKWYEADDGSLGEEDSNGGRSR